jgi:predicted HTH domain antitoxin
VRTHPLCLKLAIKLLKSQNDSTDRASKILMLSKLEEEWSIKRVATHNRLNKSTVLQVISKEEVENKKEP